MNFFMTKPMYSVESQALFPKKWSFRRKADSALQLSTPNKISRKEPFNAERLLLSTGIVNHYMDSNWENGRYSAVGAASRRRS
jgi:hypothetical protein